MPQAQPAAVFIISVAGNNFKNAERPGLSFHPAVWHSAAVCFLASLSARAAALRHRAPYTNVEICLSRPFYFLCAGPF